MTAPRIFTPEYYARMRELEAGSWWNAAMRDVAGNVADAMWTCQRPGRSSTSVADLVRP